MNRSPCGLQCDRRSENCKSECMDWIIYEYLQEDDYEERRLVSETAFAINNMKTSSLKRSNYYKGGRR